MQCRAAPIIAVLPPFSLFAPEPVERGSQRPGGPALGVAHQRAPDGFERDTMCRAIEQTTAASWALMPAMLPALWFCRKFPRATVRKLGYRTSQ